MIGTLVTIIIILGIGAGIAYFVYPPFRRFVRGLVQHANPNQPGQWANGNINIGGGAAQRNQPVPRGGNNGMWLLIGGVIFVIAILIIAGFCLVTVPAGHVGVKDTFGVVDSDVLYPGVHLKSPFTDVIIMSTQTQKYLDYGTDDKATIVALSNDGLSTTMGIALNYHLNAESAPEVYKQVGTDYTSVVMVNPVHSVPRDLISKYDTKTLYSASQEGSTDRAKLESELYDGIIDGLNKVGVPNSITIEMVSIREIDFPQDYKDSITRMMKMNTEITEKEMEVKKQALEADRVRTEAQGEADKIRAIAQGQADANRILTESLNDMLMKYAAIQMMEKHSGAVYFIPTGSDGIYQGVVSTIPVDTAT